DGAVLSWSVPAAPRTADGYVTESFESYPDFQRTPFGEWSLYDGDRMLTYGIGGWHFPANSDIQSWMIWTPTEVENSTTGAMGLSDKLWYPRTGDKMLASFAAYEGISDDWLISPELSGNAQVISFYAHGLPKAANPELFQLYFSTTGAETTNFMPLDAVPRTVPNFKDQTFTADSWNDCLFEYALPQGTKHFAIRKVSDDGWVMFLDDITFAPDTLAAQNGLMLFGYNIYKNGERLNTALVPTPSFTDALARPGDTYKVTAVYNEGESVYSNEVVISGVEGIATVSAGQSKSVRRAYDLQGRPATRPATRGVTIIDGRKVVACP
ncbi:MAG: choice-of-anchor J domain-containing protein, partial [Prevotella sp.]|nr:choice-of-anchor J domain-containing protein [Prevotella sp.]